ncbi:MAG: glycerol-3-phosphate 1-O-acyltransferase [Betaproteobacteria bacterium]|jgi:glycerol-3-phosphate acyltransferase PlsY|nr:glycerol-3-phosphate 1-O-acyltransferase [Betaproteobacteria bacterium]
MTIHFALGLAALLSYLLGSVSFAIVVSRLRGLADPRSYGSNNPGATNVLRSGDRLAAALTLFGDAAKGLIAVLLAAAFAQQWPAPQQQLLIITAGVAVFIGHLWPVFFRFQGGKGVATAFGVLLGFDAAMGLLVGLIWILVAKLSRISSLAALCAAVAAPALTFWRHGAEAMLWAVILVAVLLIARHQRNISALLTGEEKAFKKSPE